MGGRISEVRYIHTEIIYIIKKNGMITKKTLKSIENLEDISYLPRIHFTAHT